MPLSDVSNDVWTTILDMSYRKPKFWQFLARDLSDVMPIGGRIIFNRVDNRGAVSDYTGSSVPIGRISANKISIPVNEDKVSFNKLTNSEVATVMASDAALADFIEATANGLEDQLEADLFAALNAPTSLAASGLTAEVNYAPLNVTGNVFAGSDLKWKSSTDDGVDWEDATKGPANRRVLNDTIMRAQIKANSLWYPMANRVCAVSDDVAQQLALFNAENYHFALTAASPEFIEYGSPGMLWGWTIMPTIDIPDIDDSASNQMIFLMMGESFAFARRLNSVQMVRMPDEPAEVVQQHYLYGANASYSPDKRFAYTLKTVA